MSLLKTMTALILTIPLVSCSEPEQTIANYPFTCQGTDYSLGGLMKPQPVEISFDGNQLDFSIETDSGFYTDSAVLNGETDSYIEERGTQYPVVTTMSRRGDKLFTYSETKPVIEGQNSFGLPDAQDFSVDLIKCEIRPNN